MLTMGGGGVDNPTRVRTSEVMDPDTMMWSSAGDISIGNEVSPMVLLYTGEVLMNHRSPQLFIPSTGQWRPADDFVQGNRMSNGDHADHELVMLPSGEVAAIGSYSFTSGEYGNLLEIYNAQDDEWRLAANFSLV